MKNKYSVKIVIPTYNGGELWEEVAANLVKQKEYVDEILVIDSSSTDNTVTIAKHNGFNVSIISSSEFNHGGTRNLGVKSSSSDIIIFLTQDAIPEEGSIKSIIDAFDNDEIALAYGRQIPHDNANPLAIHARKFNYKETSYLASLDTVKKLGLKTVFISNSFAAYRTTLFSELGGFPDNTILCEDMFLAAKAILAKHKIFYKADAVVRHSHNYSAVEEFKRYFDIGVFHTDQSWIRSSFGGAGGEGKYFILSEIKFLARNAPLWIPVACLNNLAKIIGYKLGQSYQRIPLNFRKKISMHKRYWNNYSDL